LGETRTAAPDILGTTEVTECALKACAGIHSGALHRAATWIRDWISSSEQVREYHVGRITMTAGSVLKLALYIGISADLGREMPRKKEGI
jgi:hypothetical protein